MLISVSLVIFIVLSITILIIYTSRNTQFNSHSKNSAYRPKPLTKNVKPKHIYLIQNSDINEDYCQKWDIGHIKIKQKYIWSEIHNFLMKNEKIDYVIYLDKQYKFIDHDKDLDKLIVQGGLSDMIFCRDENHYDRINLKAIIFKNTEVSLYKLKQLHNCNHNQKKMQHIIFHQVTTDHIDSLNSKEYQNENLKDIQVSDPIKEIFGRETLKHNIDSGLPFFRTNSVIYNENAFVSTSSSFIQTRMTKKKNNCQLSYPWIHEFDQYTLINNYLHFDEIKIKDDDGTIPNIIFQHFETNLLTKDCIKYSCNIWKKQNPEYQYCFSTAIEADMFINKYYKGKTYDAYHKVTNKTYKADLFRYCLLYKYGGWWCDIHTHPFVSLDSIKENFQLVAAEDQFNGLWQGCFGISRGNILLKTLIDDVTNNFLNNSYGQKNKSLSICGPAKFGEIVNEYLFKRDINTIFEGGKYGNRVSILDFFHTEDKPLMFDYNRKKIMVNDFCSFFSIKPLLRETLYSGEPYRFSYAKKRVYKPYLNVNI